MKVPTTASSECRGDQQASGAALTGKALFEEGQSMPRFREKQGIELD